MASLDPSVLAAISKVIQQQMQPYAAQFEQLQQQQQVLLQPRDENFGTPLSRNNSGMSAYNYSASETPLSRSSSGMSSASTCSSASAYSSASSKCSQRSTSSKKKCTKRIFNAEASQLEQDRKDILVPILTFFDAAYLAPKKSPLFRKKFAKKRNADGSRKLKDKADIVHKLFKRLVRVPLTKILGEVYESDYDLAARYELAAEKIVKRRRGNHVQSWRPSKNNKHLELKYGGVLGVNPLTGIAVVHNDLVSDPEPIIAKQIAKPSRSQQQQKTRKPDLNIENMEADFDSDDDTSPPKKKSTGAKSSDPKNKSAKILRCCSSCGQTLAECDIQPKDKDSWGVDSSDVWCADCWDAKVQNELMPLMQERQAKQREAQSVKQSSKSVKKKKTRTCKCGSTTHSMTSHLDCPLNKRNLCSRDDDKTPKTTSTKETSEKPSEKTNVKKKKTCKCGSTTHQRTTCLRCPLNPKYRPEDIHELGWRGAGRGKCKDKIRAALSSKGIDVDAVELDHTASDTDHTVGEEAELVPGVDFDLDDNTEDESQIPEDESQVPEDESQVSPDAGDDDKATPPPAFLPKVGDNVIAKFERNQWFLAHVTDIDVNGLCRCYFMDGKVKKRVPLKDIRPPTGVSWPKRGEMIGKHFDYEGDDEVSSSRWVIRRMHEDMYFCTRLGVCPLNEINCDNFEIGYVIKQYVAQQHRIRELGPAFAAVQSSSSPTSTRRR